MPIIKGGKRKTFQPLSKSVRENLLNAFSNKSNVTYSQIALDAKVSKALVIAFSKKHGLRPKGNFFNSREIKQPLIKKRLDDRKRKIVLFFKKHHGNVSINQIQQEFGGEKKFIKDVLLSLKK
jgi:hypothetical protein